jgi:hypothetical protein
VHCVACGEGLAEAVYSVLDESMRYPLCLECDKKVDLCLLVVEWEAQVRIDQLSEV